jgi:sulfate transport system permease protein
MNRAEKGPGKWVIISLGIIYTGVLILGPIAALIMGAFDQGLTPVFAALGSNAFLEALWLSLKIALLVVGVQAVLGTMVAWIIVRHDFLGKAFLKSLIDVPFAMSPVVVGYMLLLLFGRNGFLSPLIENLGIKVAFAPPGIFLATLFVSLPFMVKEMIPVIENLDRSQEYAAETLGAGGWEIFQRVIFPQLRTALIYGMTLTFARALGEFGAVLVIGGGIQGRTETATMYIFRSLDERHFVEAYSAAILLGSFSVMIVLIADAVRRREEKRKFHEGVEERI